MHTVQLKIDNSIYDNVMFFLNSLKLKGLEIKEGESEESSNSKDILDFSNYDVESFKNIENPLQWQKDIRKEWD